MEAPDGAYGARDGKQTSNAQRSTLNAQVRGKAAFDLEERLLEFAARIIRCRWLRLLQLTGLASKARMVAIVGETEELIRIFSASIRTAEKNAG
jgi:hypothetical protein